MMVPANYFSATMFMFSNLTADTQWVIIAGFMLIMLSLSDDDAGGNKRLKPAAETLVSHATAVIDLRLACIGVSSYRPPTRVRPAI